MGKQPYVLEGRRHVRPNGESTGGKSIRHKRKLSKLFFHGFLFVQASHKKRINYLSISFLIYPVAAKTGSNKHQLARINLRADLGREGFS
jgi:hypothetical protein